MYLSLVIKCGFTQFFLSNNLLFCVQCFQSTQALICPKLINVKMLCCVVNMFLNCFVVNMLCELFSRGSSAQSRVLAICLSSRFTLFVQLFKYLSSHLCNYYEPHSWKYGKAWLCFRAVTFTFSISYVCTYCT